MLSQKEIKMHISTKTGYAVRALAELALNSDGKPVSISEICKKQNLPIKYLEQLFRNLKKNGLVKSVHGSKGGYSLNRGVGEISLNDIMHAVMENYSLTYCDVDKENLDYCTGLPCGFHDLWGEIQTHLEDYFDSIKLKQIISKL